MKQITSVFSKFKLLDIFGIPILLCYKERRKFKTNIGASISIGVMAICFYFFVLQLKGWINMENSQTIYSNENFSVQSLLNDNKTIEYTLDNFNYNIYFVVRAEFPNGSMILFQNLTKYFDIQYKYKTPYNVKYDPIESVPCNVRSANDFLRLSYKPDDIPINKSNPVRMCVKEPISMGLMTEKKTHTVWRPALSLQIKPCKNSTNTSSECASENEIKEIMKFISIQASIPKTIYDFKNRTNPIQRMFKYEFYRLDWNLKKSFLYEINPTFFYHDVGYFSDDYQFDNLNFNPSQQTIDINSKTDDYLFQYDIVTSFQVEKYFIRNQKLNDILGSFGGIINLLYTIGNFICFYMNYFLFMRSLLKTTFKFINFGKKIDFTSKLAKENNNKNLEQNSEIIEPKKLFNFSAFHSLFCRLHDKQEKELFEKSKKLLYGYIDIKGIIKRLQEVDKLKNVLLNDSQRFFFDLIPKPEVSCKQNKKNSLFGIENIVKIRLKQTSENIIKENHRKLIESDQNKIGERIISFLGKDTLSALKGKKGM